MRFAPLPEIDSAVNLALHRGLPLRITYWGGRNPGSSRVVRPESRHGLLLTAFCHQRREHRTFHLGRVIFAEVLPPEQGPDLPRIQGLGFFHENGELMARTTQDMVLHRRRTRRKGNGPGKPG